MTVAVGTHSAVDTDSVVHTNYDTSFLGKVQAGSMLIPAQPEPAHHSSSSRCLLSSLLGVDMLYNPSHHALLNCKIYRKG